MTSPKRITGFRCSEHGPRPPKLIDGQPNCPICLDDARRVGLPIRVLAEARPRREQ